MTRHLTIAALAALAAGCATTAADLRDRPPLATVQGNRPPAAIAQCIAESVRRVGSPAIYQGADGGTVVTFQQRDATTLVVDIDAASRITVRRVNGLIPWRGAVERCR